MSLKSVCLPLVHAASLQLLSLQPHQRLSPLLDDILEHTDLGNVLLRLRDAVDSTVPVGDSHSCSQGSILQQVELAAFLVVQVH